MGRAEEAIGPLDILVNNAGLEFGGQLPSHHRRRARGDPRRQPAGDDGADPRGAPGNAGAWARPRRQRRLAGRQDPDAGPGLLFARPSTAWSVSPTRCGRENGGEPVGFSAICPGFVSRVGMYGRIEHLAPAPRMVGTVPPESVGDAVVRCDPPGPARGDRQQTPGATAHPAECGCASPGGSGRPCTTHTRVRGARGGGPRAPLAGTPTDSFASIGGPEKGGGPSLSHMFSGTLEVQGR